MNIEGFAFLHVGDFFRNVPSPKKYKWEYEGKSYHDHLTISIKFKENELDEKKEQVYVVTVDDEAVYVGEFSGTLRERWLKSGNYIWHGKDYDIDAALKDGKSVSLWLIDNPLVELSNGVILNISKSIEAHILKNQNMQWNIKNN